jgi:ubiquinone/menaquinone biosynthesis C-methylase UbiE
MTTIASAKEQFDRQAAHYNGQWASWTDETLQRMLTLADPQPEWLALDVATGTGYTAFGFAPHVAHVTGADISSGMLAEAARRAADQGVDNVDWVEAPAEALPFADASFDLVTVRIAPHHFVDVDAFLRETRRVLRPGGVFVFGDTTVPDDDPEAGAWQNAVEYERDPSHVANLSPAAWEAHMEAAGLDVMVRESLTGAIRIALTPWLETSGAVGERAERVRQYFAQAPVSAREQFQIATRPDGETEFAWQRVILRAVRPTE